MPDVIADAVRILQNVEVPEPHDEIAKAFEVSRAPLIVRCLLGMLRAVHFDDEHRLVAKEIRDVRPAWYLAAKFQVLKPTVAQARP